MRTALLISILLFGFSMPVVAGEYMYSGNYLVYCDQAYCYYFDNNKWVLYYDKRTNTYTGQAYRTARTQTRTRTVSVNGYERYPSMLGRSVTTIIDNAVRTAVSSVNYVVAEAIRDAIRD